MTNGFELLKTRKIDNQLNISEFENKFGFSMPPLFKMFISTFELGPDTFKREMFLNPLRDEKYIISAPLYYPLQDDEKWFLSISNFDNIEKIYQDWNSFVKNEKEWLEYGFLRIADIGQGGGLFIGTRPENVDQIFQVVWDREENYFKVTESIFELVRGFELTEVDEILPDGFLKSQLYKNFGEDFWRIKI